MIALHIRLQVDASQRGAVEKTYAEVFLPALRVQQGFRGSSLYRTYARELAQEINAAEDSPDYVVELRFDSEENRRRWVASPEHVAAWPQLRALATDVSHVGSDVVITEVFEATSIAPVSLGAG